MNSYMDYVHEMAERGPRIAEMRIQAQLMSVREQDRPYHNLRKRLGAYLVRVGRQLSETPGANEGIQCLGPEGRCAPSAA